MEYSGKRLLSSVEQELTLSEYLELCKTDKLAYATASERLLAAVGELELKDTRRDERLSRIFSNEMLPTYKTFDKIYGLESTIKDIVGFVKHAAQGLEERKQILYLLGPVGSSKSSLVHILKKLMESVPFYAIKGSPVFDNPLSLFTKDDAQELGIPERYFGTIPSPVLIKRLQEAGGDLSKIKVVKLYPFVTLRIGNEVLVFDLVNFTINGGNKPMFQSMITIYANHLRAAVWNAAVNEYSSGVRQCVTSPVFDVEKEILKGVQNE